MQRTFTDQMGRLVQLDELPQRIVSLVPSQTELLYALGLSDRVVGITKFCIHPDEWFRSKTRVGGPKKLKIDTIKALQPDLIIANKEENIKEEIMQLQEVAPVWISDVFLLEDNHTMIQSIGEMCGKEEESRAIIEEIKANFAQLTPIDRPVRVLYMIWKNPFMAVASGTFIHHMLTDHLGVENAIAHEARYPMLNDDQLPETDVVFLSSEPYPFKEKHIAEVQAHFPNAKIMLVDGEYFTWYGSRLIDAPKYFATVIDRLNALN